MPFSSSRPRFMAAAAAGGGRATRDDRRRTAAPRCVAGRAAGGVVGRGRRRRALCVFFSHDERSVRCARGRTLRFFFLALFPCVSRARSQQGVALQRRARILNNAGPRPVLPVRALCASAHTRCVRSTTHGHAASHERASRRRRSRTHTRRLHTHTHTLIHLNTASSRRRSSPARRAVRWEG